MQKIQDFTLYLAMSQNGQTNFKNLEAFAARFLKCAWPFYDIAKQRVKDLKNVVKCKGIM